MKKGSREASWDLWEGSKGEEGTKVACDVSGKLCLWEANAFGRLPLPIPLLPDLGKSRCLNLPCWLAQDLPC